MDGASGFSNRAGDTHRPGIYHCPAISRSRAARVHHGHAVAFCSRSHHRQLPPRNGVVSPSTCQTPLVPVGRRAYIYRAGGPDSPVYKFYKYWRHKPGKGILIPDTVWRKPLLRRTFYLLFYKRTKAGRLAAGCPSCQKESDFSLDYYVRITRSGIPGHIMDYRSRHVLSNLTGDDNQTDIADNNTDDDNATNDITANTHRNSQIPAIRLR